MGAQRSRGATVFAEQFSARLGRQTEVGCLSLLRSAVRSREILAEAHRILDVFLDESDVRSFFGKHAPLLPNSKRSGAAEHLRCATAGIVD